MRQHKKKMDFNTFKSKFEKEPVKEYPNNVSTNPMVSICVQAYNQKQFIDQCLENILVQKTDFDYEIILGEDDSDDGTREICIGFAEKYPDRIRLLLHQKENKIKIAGKNTGLFNSAFNLFSANGKYIAYCDGDDFWSDAFKLQQQVDFLENNREFVLTYHDVVLTDEKGKHLNNDSFDQAKRDFSSEELKKVIVQPVISTWCFRNTIRNIPIELLRTINADNFWISLLGHYGKGKFLENIGPSHYRFHDKGIWSMINRDQQLISKMKTFKNLSQYYLKLDDKQLEIFFSKRSENYCKRIIFHYFSKKDYLKTVKYLLSYFEYKLKRF